MQPSKLLEKLSSFTDKKREQKGSWVVIFFVSIFAIFVFAMVAGKNAKEVAKLKHARNKRRVEDENMKLIGHRELNNEKITEISVKIESNRTEIDNLDKEIEVAEMVHRKNLKNINSITGWKDI